MKHRLYRESRRRADWGTAVIVLLFLATSVQRATQGLGRAAAVFLTVAVLVALLRLVRGPLRGAAVIEIDGSEIAIRQPFYIPTRVQRLPLEGLRSLEIAGGRGDRHFRFGRGDGSMEEVRPRFGPAFEPKAVEFLLAHLPQHVRVVERPPASWLARAQGNF